MKKEGGLSSFFLCGEHVEAFLQRGPCRTQVRNRVSIYALERKRKRPEQVGLFVSSEALSSFKAPGTALFSW